MLFVIEYMILVPKVMLLGASMVLTAIVLASLAACVLLIERGFSIRALDHSIYFMPEGV